MNINNSNFNKKIIYRKYKNLSILKRESVMHGKQDFDADKNTNVKYETDIQILMKRIGGAM